MLRGLYVRELREADDFSDKKNIKREQRLENGKDYRERFLNFLRFIKTSEKYLKII